MIRNSKKRKNMIEKIIEIWGKIKVKHEEYWLWQKE